FGSAFGNLLIDTECCQLRVIDLKFSVVPSRGDNADTKAIEAASSSVEATSLAARAPSIYESFPYTSPADVVLELLKPSRQLRYLQVMGHFESFSSSNSQDSGQAAPSPVNILALIHSNTHRTLDIEYRGTAKQQEYFGP
ncbi:hypothetical protein BGZ83_005333, partial [Gryganskiella cystojenkinii]